MLATGIVFFARECAIVCDGRCDKAWGINSRPRVQLSDAEDDYEFLADGELDEAPADPRTYEGGQGKPESTRQGHNKWCARECERSKRVYPGEPFELPDFSQRVRNKPEPDAGPESAVPANMILAEQVRKVNRARGMFGTLPLYDAYLFRLSQPVAWGDSDWNRGETRYVLITRNIREALPPRTVSIYASNQNGDWLPGSLIHRFETDIIGEAITLAGWCEVTGAKGDV